MIFFFHFSSVLVIEKGMLGILISCMVRNCLFCFVYLIVPFEITLSLKFLNLEYAQ